MTNHTIQKIIEKLEKYPDVMYSVTDNAVTVGPKDKKGFTASINVGSENIIVSADFWHEHFDIGEEDEALECFAFMLSDTCRLVDLG